MYSALSGPTDWLLCYIKTYHCLCFLYKQTCTQNVAMCAGCNPKRLGDKISSECHTDGHMPHEKEAAVVWIREEMRVRAQRNSTMRRRLQWCGYVRR